MPCPKKKHSRKRTGHRRANWKFSISNTGTCPQCGEPKLPHRVCLNCGFYNGELIVPKKEKKSKTEKTK